MTKYRLHETPVEIAECLSAAAPPSAKKILEPSVGNGALVDAICKQLPSFEQIVCVDINQEITCSLENEYRPNLKDRLKVVNSDFLEWSIGKGRERYGEYFDLVVMNPPFIAKTDNWVNINWSYNQIIRNRAPLEVAFIINTLPLLKKNGTLLSVLPTSVISSKQLKWFRKALMSIGKILSVHELPEFSFPGIESKIYLFEFNKGCRQSHVILKNHSLENPDTVKIYDNNLNKDLRLDYNFYEGKNLIEKIKLNSKNLNWNQLEQEVEVIRGREESPKGAARAVHTTEYKEGFWHINNSKDYKIDNESIVIEKGDILCKRVGRNCSNTFGLPLDLEGYNCSDCVFVIKPYEKNNTTKILFCLRVLFCNYEGKKYLERGTGAKYLSIKDLRDCSIPLNLSNLFEEEFEDYKVAINNTDFTKMELIERRVFDSIKQN